MKQQSFEDYLNSLTNEQRIAVAKDCVEELTRRIQIVLELHATNEIVCYSDVLTSQIPISKAANAYNLLSDSLFNYQVIRLLALWDPASTNAVSIPTALRLINDEDVIEMLCLETYAAHANRPVRMLNPSDDPAIKSAIDQIVDNHQIDFARSQAEKAELSIKACIDAAASLADDELKEGLKNLRDRVAHSVTETRSELRGKTHRAKYGYERQLLERTIKIIEDLYCWVNGTSFDISGDCLDLARANASDLWNNCSFKVPDWREE